ncbi:type II toxin-antitoxin system PemK/MazF family toxin [Parafilimonas sp.]|uniref:type II toxin-antitoxin system PemK/MazF family toxin n=1 Tax=Parafilimonas sp. TaxID=1969739 RepID=UPI003F7E864D
MYKQGEIVLVPFPYSDLSASKRRPALVVVSNNLYNGRFPDIVVCVITSNLYKDNFSVELNDNNLQSGILPESSIIKCHKLFTIEQSRIIKKFSKVKDDKLKEVISMLHNLFQN